ncbi:GntR family transcriptional regulator [Mangrovicoccus sp. HB161399]|uniref:GntR family transcriptional regulator n=1 Tax=Mangrovicoccus sp. HB161399 TaxID=2720392 RepID=UPI0015558A05|nr:GntR family transcriptional regulator [Mangrovicoccus sp. HB161399]
MSVSKTAEVYESLREELLDGNYRPGAKLGIDALAARFGASPSVLREALSRLTSDRLVTAMPQRGFAVAELSLADLDDLTEVRIEVETRCIVRSVLNGDVDWEAALLASWHRLASVGATPEGRRHPDWEGLHAKFHDDLVAACDSAWWLRLRGALYMQAERYRRAVRAETDRTRDVEAEHRELLELAMCRDAEGAAQALAQHLERTVRAAREAGLPDWQARGAAPARERVGGTK